MTCFGFGLPGSMSLFSFLFHLQVFALLLSGVLLPFLCLKGLVNARLFAKLGCCRTLCPFFLRDPVANYS
jgi:hypothetical protein